MIQLRRILLVEGLIAFAAACARFTELIITKIIKANLPDRRFAVKRQAYFFKAFKEYTSDLILQPGMIFCSEPKMFFKNEGYMRVEDMILVTEDGYEILTY